MRHEVADGGDVEFVGGEEVAQEVGCGVDFAPEKGLLFFGEIDDFLNALAPWNEEQPGEALIVHQENGAEGELTHGDAGVGELGVNGEGDFVVHGEARRGASRAGKADQAEVFGGGYSSERQKPNSWEQKRGEGDVGGEMAWREGERVG